MLCLVTVEVIFTSERFLSLCMAEATMNFSSDAVCMAYSSCDLTNVCCVCDCLF